MVVSAGPSRPKNLRISFHHIRRPQPLVPLNLQQQKGSTIQPKSIERRQQTMKSARHATECINEAKQAGLPSLDAELLMLFALKRQLTDRAWLKMCGTEPIDENSSSFYHALCSRRINGEPLAYITGERGFYGLNLKVDARVLDPRPDTETLVDWALDILQNIRAPQVADLGTGSGAIALALQHQRPDAKVLAVDASADALAVAQANAQRLKLPVHFALGFWLSPLADAAPPEGLHLIASNPPYIAENDPHMAALHHEPRQALTSGSDGLNDIRHIVSNAPTHLRPGGWLLLEHGYNQTQAVQALLRDRGFSAVQSRNDLAGIARCTGGIWSAAPNAG